MYRCVLSKSIRGAVSKRKGAEKNKNNNDTGRFDLLENTIM